MKWITALDLETWADTLVSRTVFPELIGDLVRASAKDIRSYRFASGDSSQIRGFDGFLNAAECMPYVPGGDSIWEFGVAEGAAAKASKDFRERSKAFSPEELAERTFVFASPRRWDNPKKKLQDWVAERRREAPWRDVMYLDAVQIESWLDLNPAVAAYYAKYKLEKLPASDVVSIEEFWDEYSARFAPDLKEAVLLCDREGQAKNVVAALAGEPSQVSISADSPDEVVAFAVAAIRNSPTDVRLFLESRTLIVESESAARQLSNRRGLVFIPRGRATLLSGRLAKTGATLVAIGRDDRTYGQSHDALPRPTVTSLGQALASMGFEGDAAIDLARRCGRSVTVLARMIASGRAEPPEWKASGGVLIPALLAGAWSETSDLDKEVLRGLASSPTYDAFETPLRSLAALRDPPLDRVDDVWAMRAPVDAFVQLGHLVGAGDLARLSAAANAVFGTIRKRPDPDEVFDAKRERVGAHSQWLRDGLATTLLLIAVMHQQAKLVVPGSTPQDYVNGIINSLPGLAENHRLIESLGANLPLLAEAAPLPFVDALERLLEGAPAEARRLFAESEHIFGPTSPHVFVLFALETLAWDPALLGRVAVVLARLAEIDPGGHLQNRPINSLRTIFLSWVPNTNATLAQRLGVLDTILSAHPDVGWNLLKELLPRSSDSSSPAHKPKLREAGDSSEVLTYRIVWDSQKYIVRKAIALAAGNGSRLVTIVEKLGDFEPELRLSALTAIDEYLSLRNGSEPDAVWSALQKQLNRHRAFAKAAWALKNDELDALKLIVEKHKPSDLIGSCAWLFNEWAPDVREDQADSRLDALEVARGRAVEQVLREAGVEGIKRLASEVKLPHLVAGAMRSLSVDVEIFTDLAKWGARGQGELSRFATVASAVAFETHGGEWLAQLSQMQATATLEREKLASLLLALPFDDRTRPAIKAFGADVEGLYWSQVSPMVLGRDSVSINEVAQEFLRAGRALAAISLLYDRSGEVEPALLFQVLDRAVIEINKDPSSAAGSIGYYVEQIFESIESREDISKEDVAMREYSFLPLLERRNKPLVLHSILLSNPSMFVSLIADVFRSENEPEVPVTEERKARAGAAYHLLRSIAIVPGQKEGNVDYVALKTWCEEVRALAKPRGHARIADQYIGHILAHSPADTADGAWPHDSVRRVLEGLGSEDVEIGVRVERHNMRGVFSKSIGEGGAQERILADQYREWAKKVGSYPRVLRLLWEIAESWEEDGKREEVRAEKDRLRW